MQNVEDMYSLAPMQQGMLFHSLYETKSGQYMIQVRCILRGNLNPTLFERAWNATLARHRVLGTALAWEELDEPVQIVYQTVTLPFECSAWRSLSSEKQNAGLFPWLWLRERHEDLVVGTDIATRTHRESEDVVGFFINQLVLRCQLIAELTLQQVLKRLRQGVPFEAVVEMLNPRRELSSLLRKIRPPLIWFSICRRRLMVAYTFSRVTMPRCLLLTL